MEPEEFASAVTPNTSAFQELNTSVVQEFPDFNSTEWHLVYTIIPPYLFIICVTGILGNFFVLLVFFLQGTRWSVPEIYLGNLALADLILLVALPFWAMNILNQFVWSYGEFLCKMVTVSINVNMYASIYMLVMVNVDRYLALVLTLRARWLRRKRYAKIICVILWLFGLGMGSLLSPFLNLNDIPGQEGAECVLQYPNPQVRTAHLIELNVLGFAIPFLIITFCSLNILRALKRRRDRGLSEDRNDRKATILVCAVTFLFFICWGPFHFMTFLDILCDFQVLDWRVWDHFLNIGHQFSAYLSFANSCLNPMLYVCSGNYFKKKVHSIYRRRKRFSDTMTLQPTVLTTATMSKKIKPVVITEND